MDNKRMMYTSEDVCMCEKVKKKIDEALDELYQYAKQDASTFGDLENKIIEIQRVFNWEENCCMEGTRFIRKSLEMRMKNEIERLSCVKAIKDALRGDVDG